MCSVGRVFCLSVSLFVCPHTTPLFDLFVCSGHSEWLIIHSTGSLGEKVDCRWSTIIDTYIKIRSWRSACFDKKLNVAFQCDNHFSFKSSLNSALVHICLLVTLDHLFSTFKGSRLLNVLPTSFFPRLAITAASFQSMMIFTSLH